MPHPLFEGHAGLEALSAWALESGANDKPLKYFVGMDIGGTNTRVSVARDGVREQVALLKIASSSLPEILSSLRDILPDVLLVTNGLTATRASVAVAGPIESDGLSVVLTNFPGKDLLKVSDLPTGLFPTGQTSLCNDLEAAAYGILSLGAEQHIPDFFRPLYQSALGQEALQPHNYLVVAAGTGLGVAMLYYNRRSSGHMVVPLEAGHCLSAVQGSMDLAAFFAEHGLHDTTIPIANSAFDAVSFITAIQMRLHAQAPVWSVEYEDIASGRGVVLAFQLLGGDPSLTAGDIAKNAAEFVGNPEEEAEGEGGGKDALRCAQALFIHYMWVWNAIQNMCIPLQCKGVIFCGDNQVSNDAFFTAYQQAWRQQFLSHPKKDWLEPVLLDVLVQTKPVNMNVRGALYLAELA